MEVALLTIEKVCGFDSQSRGTLMLVLSRKEGERIHIGEVTLIVTKCGRGRVTVGIDAPTEIRILRGEVLESILRERAAIADATQT
jgi:carbon storage regulator